MKTTLLRSLTAAALLSLFAIGAAFALTVDQTRIMSARAYADYHPTYWRVTINFNDQNIGAGQAFGALAQGEFIRQIDCHVTTAFNAASMPRFRSSPPLITVFVMPPAGLVTGCRSRFVMRRLYHVPSNCRRRLRNVTSVPASISLSVSGVMFGFPATRAWTRVGIPPIVGPVFNTTSRSAYRGRLPVRAQPPRILTSLSALPRSGNRKEPDTRGYTLRLSR